MLWCAVTKAALSSAAQKPSGSWSLRPIAIGTVVAETKPYAIYGE